TLYQVQFRIPDGLGTEPIEVGIHEQWTEQMQSSSGGEYWAGFRIIDIDPADRERLVAYVGD
ncbi:MAG: PilZ domain-containing protein, partial [Lysobacterales bacterium]